MAIINIHFHPDGLSANQFVMPLIKKEIDQGNKAILMVSKNRRHKNDIQITYELSIKNLLLLPLSFLRIIRLLINRHPSYIVSHNSKSSLIGRLDCIAPRI